MNKKALFHPKIKWIAHRGLSSQSVENTLEAFMLAGNLPFFGIETDVHQTIDNVLVLHHDDNTKNSTSRDLFIDQVDFKTLAALKIKNTHKIPTLKEYLTICKLHKKVAVIELKAPFTKLKVMHVLDEVNVLNYLEHTIFISFYLDNLIFVREIDKHVPIQLLLSEVNPLTISFVKAYKFDVNVHHTALTKDLVDDLHQAGILVNCWTVNNQNDAKRCIDMGVDFITTDGF